MCEVFLRALEYYEGVLFLTTNKVGSFDEAFKSRISMALYYPPLKKTQTKRIWEIQMEHTEQLSIEASPTDESRHVKFHKVDIMEFVRDLWDNQQSQPEHKPVWNGRQIRNAFQTAVALAEWQKQNDQTPGPIQVRREHFDKVARVSMEFNSYLYAVKHWRGDSTLNKKKEQRYDDFNPTQTSQIGFGGQEFPFGQQQGFGGLGAWNLSQQQQNMGPYGAQAGANMSAPQRFGPQFPLQGGAPMFQSWNAGPSGMGNAATMGNSGVISAGMGQPGMGNMGMGNMSMGIHPIAMNVPDASNQNMHTQSAEQSTSSNAPRGGVQQQPFRHGEPQPGAGGWGV